MHWTKERLDDLRECANAVRELTKYTPGDPSCDHCDNSVGFVCERCHLERAARELATYFLAEDAEREPDDDEPESHDDCPYCEGDGCHECDGTGDYDIGGEG